jgi:hypothetical protein
MTNLHRDNWKSETEATSSVSRERRLWFEVATSGIAWFALGLADMFITWRACVHHEQFGGASADAGARILYFAMWILLFGLSLLAGIMSYRRWRALYGGGDLLYSEGRERREFMAQAGFFISVTLGIGFIWLALPLFILELCARVR